MLQRSNTLCTGTFESWNRRIHDFKRHRLGCILLILFAVNNGSENNMKVMEVQQDEKYNWWVVLFILYRRSRKREMGRQKKWITVMQHSGCDIYGTYLHLCPNNFTLVCFNISVTWYRSTLSLEIYKLDLELRRKIPWKFSIYLVSGWVGDLLAGKVP